MIFRARVFVLGSRCTHPDPEIMLKEAAHSVTTANYPQFGQLSFVFCEEILSNPSIVFNRNMFHDIRLLLHKFLIKVGGEIMRSRWRIPPPPIEKIL